MKNNIKKYFSQSSVRDGILFFCIGIALMLYSFINHYSVHIEWKLSPYLFPVLISFFIIALAIVLCVGGIREATAEQSKEESSEPSPTQWKTVLIYIAAVVAYYILMPFFGFVITTIALLVVLFLFLGERSWIKIAVLAIFTSFAIYYLFHVLLHVMLP
ncbi:MAG: tripartite tricarboxylate transporter TctB family protein [Treponema sp.]|nr:tripartite tricarboxylate transporter TctB family protein [Treponema sp.]